MHSRIKARPTRPWPKAPPRGFRGPALSKVKEMCGHSYLSHEKSEKNVLDCYFCFMYPRVFTKEGSCGAPLNIFGLGPLKALIRPCMHGAMVARLPLSG